MKLVIDTNNKNDVVDVSKVSNEKYYGFSMGLNGKSCGYILGHFDGYVQYSATFFFHLTKCNRWGKMYSTLSGCLSALMSSRDDVKVFEFDTYKELLKWGSEQ